MQLFACKQALHGLIVSCNRCLQHGDEGIRAKACNLLGNCYRHSAFFYAESERYNILACMLLACCLHAACMLRACTYPHRARPVDLEWRRS